jgi:prevent-host-death family protein
MILVATVINIHDAKTHLSRIVEEVAAGKEVVIAKAGKPMARLVPMKQGVTKKRLGMLKGKIKVPADFNDPLPEAVIRLFGKN